MEQSDNRFGGRALCCFLLMLLVTGGGIAGCAAMRADPARDMNARKIWQTRDQYVAIEMQDRQSGGTTPANAHPAAISTDRLRSALASIEVLLPGGDKTVPLFNDPEVKILTEKIREGLALAGPDQDVTFAIVGYYATLAGVFKESKVTTARVFCRDGELNIIFGDVLRDVREQEDRRLNPFLPGSRTAVATLNWTLAARAGGEHFAVKRPDWLTFPLTGSATPLTVPAAREDSGSSVTGGKAAAPAVAPEKPAPAEKKSVEERLMLLNELRNKKLITEEEYRAKRLEILNEL
jgi:hypothetical protein